MLVRERGVGVMGERVGARIWSRFDSRIRWSSKVGSGGFMRGGLGVRGALGTKRRAAGERAPRTAPPLWVRAVGGVAGRSCLARSRGGGFETSRGKYFIRVHVWRIPCRVPR